MLYFVQSDEKLFNAIRSTEEKYNIRLYTLRGNVQNTMLMTPEELNDLSVNLEAQFIELGKTYAKELVKSFKDLYYDVLKHIIHCTDNVSELDIEMIYDYHPIEGETVETLLAQVYEAKKIVPIVEQQIFDAQLKG